MYSGRTLKQILPFLSAISLLFCACTTYTLVEDWTDIPSNSIIEVHTNDGEIYELRKWKIENDRSITGEVKSKSPAYKSITISKKSIVNIYVIGSPISEGTETAITVAGSLVIAAAVIWAIYFFQHVIWTAGGV